MTRALFTEHDYPDVDLERGVLEAAGIELVLGDCKTEDALISEGRDVDAFLVQYASITEKVIRAPPPTRAVGAPAPPVRGGRGGAPHALSLVLALIRNVVGYHRDVNAGTW